MIEQRRGCGFRKIGGTYIEGHGLSVLCDRLPFIIIRCPTCGEGIKFSRGFTWLDWNKYAGHHKVKGMGKCVWFPVCPICHPKEDEIYGLMWVGKQYYSTSSFVSEAEKQGVCKRIGSLPRNIKLDETWILLAHKEAGSETVDDPETLDGKKEEPIPAIFYAFKPSRIVKMITKEQAEDKNFIKKLEKRGIIPLVSFADGKGNIRQSFTLKEWESEKENFQDFIES